MARWLLRYRICGVALLLAAPLLTACAGTPSDQDKKNLEGGFASYSRRQYSAAERSATAYIEKFPKDKYVDEALYLRGLARQGLGNRAGAEKDLNDAIAKADRFDLKAKANRALGDMAYEDQHFDAAIGYYNASVAASIGPDPRKPSGAPEAAVYERLGASLQAVGKWSDAKPYFDRALASGPDPSVVQRVEARRYAVAFQLQFGVFADAANARTLVAALKTQGFAATLVNESHDGKTMWYVRAGNFQIFSQAEGARQGAAAKKLNPIIVP